MRLSVSSLGKVLEHPALLHRKRPFQRYRGRRQEGEGKGTGKILQRNEIRRETLTAVDTTKCRAPHHINRHFHQITSNLMNCSLSGKMIAKGGLVTSLEKSRKTPQIKIL